MNLFVSSKVDQENKESFGHDGKLTPADPEETVTSRSSITRGIMKAMCVYLVIITSLVVLKYGKAQENNFKRDLNIQKSTTSKYAQRLGSAFRLVNNRQDFSLTNQASVGFHDSDTSNTDHSPYEVFTVTDPDIPSSYGSSLYSAQLLNHTFANSYGHPAIATFSPPTNIEFNRVVVTLDTSVSYVQYDRLAHLYVAGTEVWRTSTIEPSGSSTPNFSKFRKDLSDFSNLFKDDSQIIFQLDNVVDNNIKGEFQVVLSVDFYYAPYEEKDLTGDYSIFSINKPADSVYPLIKSNSSNPPIVTIEDSLIIQLPTVSNNSTRLILRIFSSGNGDEEFWYTGVIDENTQMFGQTWGGHGPIRILNVYFNDEKISTISPEPVIFTGGFSPALWTPVVCTDAFDLPAYDVDITALLPHLWESSPKTKKELRIQISNGIGEIGKAASTTVANGWITSASILGYEHNDVVATNGTLGDINQKKGGDVYATTPQDSYIQVISISFSTWIQSTLSITLSNGNVLNAVASFTSGSGSFNIQGYYDSANVQNIAHYGISSNSFQLTDENSSQFYEFNSTGSYPLIIDTNYLQSDNNDSKFRINVDHAKSEIKKANSRSFYEVESSQSAESIQVLSSSGNYGSASGSTNFTLNVDENFDTFRFGRSVSVVNNSVTADESSTDEFSSSGIRSQNSLVQYDFFLDEAYTAVNESSSSTDNLAQLIKKYFDEIIA